MYECVFNFELARIRVIHFRAQQQFDVATRDDAHQFVILRYRQMPYVMLQHPLARIEDRRIERHGLRKRENRNRGVRCTMRCRTGGIARSPTQLREVFPESIQANEAVWRSTIWASWQR